MRAFPACRITFLLAAAFCSFPPPARCAPADDSIEKTGIRGGLAVVIGCRDTAIAAHLLKSGPFLVCCLDPDPDVVSAARSALRKKGINGPATACRLTGDRLPFVDNTVNVIIVTRGGLAIPAAEIQRSLAPGGAIVDLAASGAKVTRKPRPDAIDAWTHYLYDASNNAVSNDTVVAPPRGLRWKCGPRYARSHEHFGSVCAMVASSGRIFYIHDDGPISSVFLPPKWELVARDAFSGVLLWKRPVGNWESQLRGFRSGPPEIGRRLVFGGGRLYAALRYGGPVAVIDPATGEDLTTLAGSDGARELLFADGRLYILADDMTADDHEKRKKWFNTKAPSLRGYGFPKEPIPMYGRQRVVAFDAQSGKQLWCNRDDRAPGEIMPATIAVSAGRVCFQTTTDVVCLDADTGKRQWKTSRPVAVSRFSWATPTLVVDDGVVVTGDRMPGDNIKKKPERGSEWIMDNHHQMQKQPGEVIAFSLDEGTELWRAPAFENYTVPMDIFVIDGRVWTGHIRGRGHPGFTTGRDLKTGAVTATVPDNKKLYQLRMGHNRCYRNRATRRYLILGRDGIEFVDPKKGTGSGHWWIRGTCQYGVMPANGLVYAPVHSCGCHPEEKLNGFNTLAPISSAPKTGADDAERLAKGPATGTKAGKTAGTDWPTYRRDARRSGHQDIDAPNKIAAAWTVECAAPLTAPVCAGGTVYVAETDAHTLRALDARDGGEKWHFIADGRIDSPPTVCGDCCIFGTRNGFVYCLRTADGKQSWRFRAAPRDRRLFCYGQIESAWPVHGAVLVDSRSGSNPVAYFAAGRTSHLDGGIRLCALDIASGSVLHEATVCMNDTAAGDGVIAARALPDILSLQDGSIYMRNIRFDRKLAPQKNNIRHLYAPGGFLDDSWWHRTYWIYGTRMLSGYGGWPKIGNVTPAGRLLVYDGGDLIYGYGRMTYRAGAGHVSPDAAKDYMLFAEVRSPKPKPESDTKKKKNRRRGPRGHREITWSKDLPFIARALVLSRDALLVAGGAGLPGTGAEQQPGTLRIVSREDGEQRVACNLPAPPVLDGMILAGDGVFVAVTDGKVVCLK